MLLLRVGAVPALTKLTEAFGSWPSGEAAGEGDREVRETGCGCAGLK